MTSIIQKCTIFQVSLLSNLFEFLSSSIKSLECRSQSLELYLKSQKKCYIIAIYLPHHFWQKKILDLCSNTISARPGATGYRCRVGMSCIDMPCNYPYHILYLSDRIETARKVHGINSRCRTDLLFPCNPAPRPI